MIELNKIYNEPCLETLSKMENGRFKKGQHWRLPKPHWEKEWLYVAYIVEKRTIPELATLCGCTDSNITYWIKKHNIPFRSVSETRKFKYWGLEGEKNGMYNRRKNENPNWRGGLTPERQSLCLTKEWKLIVQIVFKRDEYKCKKCGCHKTQLHVHHIVPFSVKELRLEINNLILLCKNCHSWVHSKKNVNKQMILTHEQFKEIKR